MRLPVTISLAYERLMPACVERSLYGGAVCISRYSQNANVFARGEFRKSGNDLLCHLSHAANMQDDDDDGDLNGGPNHLRAWMEFRKMKGQALAEALGGNVTPGMVSDLVNSKRKLSARWLRRLAPLLGTTPGTLLDFHPSDLPPEWPILPGDMLKVLNEASEDQLRQIADITKVILSAGKTYLGEL